MPPTDVSIDPYLNDPLHWGASMVHHRELMLRCLDAVGARSIIEIGAYAGDLTRALAAWAHQCDATVVAVDPAPQDQLVALAATQTRIDLIREPSLVALPRIPPADAIIIDGDHNYYTVTQELRAVEQRAPGEVLPLLLFHDVSWPHARRDDYFDPVQVPPRDRRPVAGEGQGIAPGDPGTSPSGLPYPGSASREGGPRNGVLTAVEDFVAADDRRRLAIVPAFFGFGAVWHSEAPWADRVAQVLEPWDGDGLLARLEANRVEHIAGEHALRVALWTLQERQSRQEEVLQRLLESRAFRVAERLSRLRVRAGVAPGQSVISRAEIRRALQC